MLGDRSRHSSNAKHARVQAASCMTGPDEKGNEKMTQGPRTPGLVAAHEAAWPRRHSKHPDATGQGGWSSLDEGPAAGVHYPPMHCTSSRDGSQGLAVAKRTRLLGSPGGDSRGRDIGRWRVWLSASEITDTRF